MRGVVDKKQHPLAVFAQIFDKLNGKGEDLIAKVDRSAYIKNVELFLVQDRNIGIFENSSSFSFFTTLHGRSQTRKRAKAPCSGL